ncbi:MAG: Asp-tRNA(Asn)/Glu-tRNA(Gln) amidotransferase subunit GatC, partial [Planctomycetota bacterium]|nr:Asp-tRNA(Asn)/Glu-tRNA(Gln) amidotransferase subunit GatC [Planctomycetota bacterium]
PRPDPEWSPQPPSSSWSVTLRWMTSSDSNSAPTLADVAKVAALSRLALDPDALDSARGDLLAILQHVANLQTLDVEGVEPMPKPQDTVNRLAEDVPGPSLDRDVLLAMAPKTEGHFIAVPKVLGEGGA